jgi:DnaJ-class molecular chaperone
MSKKKRCKECNGTGSGDTTESTICGTCMGTGTNTRSLSALKVWQPRFRMKTIPNKKKNPKIKHKGYKDYD